MGSISFTVHKLSSKEKRQSPYSSRELLGEKHSVQCPPHLDFKVDLPKQLLPIIVLLLFYFIQLNGKFLQYGTTSNNVTSNHFTPKAQNWHYSQFNKFSKAAAKDEPDGMSKAHRRRSDNYVLLRNLVSQICNTSAASPHINQIDCLEFLLTLIFQK